ncbi:MAG: FMN-binding negative transcriptional regulator [Alphaproteobacteria bacterium]
MYLPHHFREDRLEAQHDFIRARPLGTLVTNGPRGLDASLVPFIVDAAASPLGTLRAHLARANPHWRIVEGAAEVLVLFQDAGTYVSPSWYATKRATGKVVPTWNYVVVQAWGRPRVIGDAGWLRTLVGALTERHEAGRPDAWSVNDAPPSFIEAQLKAIIGIEIAVTRIEGKWKVSQNRPEADRAGVIQALEAQGDDASRAMARWVRERGGDDPTPSR